MRKRTENKPAHIVEGNVLDALGFSASEASALKVKAEIFSAILDHIRTKGYTQKQLMVILDEYQPSVSNLLKGRIAQVSIEKLLRYADSLQLHTSIAIRPVDSNSRQAKSPASRKSRPPSKLAIAV